MSQIDRREDPDVGGGGSGSTKVSLPKDTHNATAAHTIGLTEARDGRLPSTMVRRDAITPVLIPRSAEFVVGIHRRTVVVAPRRRTPRQVPRRHVAGRPATVSRVPVRSTSSSSRESDQPSNDAMISPHR